MVENSRKNVLLVFPELPYPARQNGVSIRYAPIIELMSQRYDLHVAIVLRPGAGGDLGNLSDYCRSIHVYQRQAMEPSLLSRMKARILCSIPGQVAHPLYCYDRKEIESFLKGVADERRYDAVVWASSWYADIGIKLFDNANFIFDAVDSTYHWFIRRQHKGLFDWIDARILLHWEKKLIRRTKATIFVSKIDADLYAGDGFADKVHVIPNGIYLADFEETQGRVKEHADTLGFLGNMGYQPNIDATMRLEKIFSELLQRDPNFELLVIGRDPADNVKALDEHKQICVTGTVDNIWPFMHKVDFFIFPMVSGAGQQNKVIEAMYAKKVVVCTPLANSGVGGENGKSLVMCDTDEDFVETILFLKRNPSVAAEIAENAHRFVKEQFSWTAKFPKIENLWFS